MLATSSRCSPPVAPQAKRRQVETIVHSVRSLWEANPTSAATAAEDDWSTPEEKAAELEAAGQRESMCLNPTRKHLLSLGFTPPQAARAIAQLKKALA